MKVALKEIKSSKKRVRRSWDVDKLAELTRSIEEQGMLVPVKLRPTDGKYDIVFGHRRVAAAREAGLDEVEAIVEGIDDDAKYIQALTENVVREDMAAYDIALALKVIKDATGYTNEKIGEMFGWVKQSVQNYLAMLPFEDVIKDHAHGITHQHVMQAKAGTSDDEDATVVLKKAADEDLSQSQTRALAEEYTRAKTGFGARGAKTVLDKPWLTSQSTAESLDAQATSILKRKPASRELEEGTEIQVSWVKDQRVIAAEQALKDISNLVSIMIRSGDDPGGAREAIKRLHKLASRVVDQMDGILGEG